METKAANTVACPCKESRSNCKLLPYKNIISQLIKHILLAKAEINQKLLIYQTHYNSKLGVVVLMLYDSSSFYL